ncbi:polyubiquitin, partial [Haematococcus lacustris]
LLVKQLTGIDINMHRLHGASLVQDLKQAVQDKVGIPPDQQRITYAGRQLEDWWALEDCGWER